MIFKVGGKNCNMKNGKWIKFPESRYVNSNPVCHCRMPKIMHMPIKVGISMHMTHANF